MKTFLFIFLGTFLSYIAYFSFVESNESSLLTHLWNQESSYFYENQHLKKQLAWKQSQLVDLQNQLREEKAKSLLVKVEKKARSIASTENEFVKEELYSLEDSQLKQIAFKYYHKKEYFLASQYFDVLLKEYPESSVIDDQTYYFAGLAYYRSSQELEQSRECFKKVVEEFPNSEFRLQAKIWIGIAYLQIGKEDKFIEVVQEFKEKYRNTEEWKMLSQYYGKMSQKYSF